MLQLVMQDFSKGEGFNASYTFFSVERTNSRRRKGRYSGICMNWMCNFFEKMGRIGGLIWKQE